MSAAGGRQRPNIHAGSSPREDFRDAPDIMRHHMQREAPASGSIIRDRDFGAWIPDWMDTER